MKTRRYPVILLLFCSVLTCCTPKSKKQSEGVLQPTAPTVGTPDEAHESKRDLKAKQDVARLGMLELTSEAFPRWSMQTGEVCPSRIEDLYVYLAVEPMDPWGQKYLMVCGEAAGPVGFGVISSGPDKKLKTADDLRSWDEYLMSDDDRTIAETVLKSRKPPEQVEFCGQEFAPYTTDLSCSEEVTDLRPLAKLTNLKKLLLVSFQLKDISPLANLTQLTKLHLDGTSVEDLSPLRSLANLRELKLGSTFVRDLTPLAKLTNLEYLSLGLNRGQLKDISPLANLNSLRYLNLALTSVEDLGPLASLSSLTTLHLIDSQVKDIGPLAKLSNLTELSVGATVTKAQVKKLQAALPSLKINHCTSRVCSD